MVGCQLEIVNNEYFRPGTKHPFNSVRSFVATGGSLLQSRLLAYPPMISPYLSG